MCKTAEAMCTYAKYIITVCQRSDFARVVPIESKVTWDKFYKWLQSPMVIARLTFLSDIHMHILGPSMKWAEANRAPNMGARLMNAKQYFHVKYAPRDRKRPRGRFTRPRKQQNRCKNTIKLESFSHGIERKAKGKKINDK